jgi:cytosol alanyl aminopeptidase
MNRLCLVLVLCVSGFAADIPPKTRLAEVEDIQPTSYKADLTLDPTKDTYSGSISIRMQVNKPVQTIWLNQEKLSIKSAVLTSRGVEHPARIVPGGDNFVGLNFDAPVPADTAVLAIEYAGGVFTKNSVGIFRQQESGNWYLFSQFEATDARAAFPCFDEPSYKTPWQLTLHVPEGDAAISNTPVESETSANGTKTLIFKQTKPLPSYLVAFAVGPFEFVNAGVAGRNKVPVRIVVPKGKTGEAKYAAEVTATILTRLEDYFGIPYPYEKADQVAVPDTAGWGAMENPGMVTYAQNLILADPKVDQISRQRRYAEDAAHELAHQWFGDLVTTAWWDDIWLNEAFATWMERKLIAEWKPEWQTRVGDVADKLRAEGEDSLISVRKIRQPILSNDDINNAFDDITYQKGASVIGMFENWMGPEEFRKGVQSYLKQYTFRAATAGEFLDSISSASKRNVTAAFSTFLNQAGVPIVSVALDCKGEKAELKVDQQRFLPVGSKGSTDQKWGIPLCVRYGTGATGRSQCTLVTEASQTVALEGAKGCPAWVQGNDGAKGYYRVDYKGGLLDALIANDAAGDSDKRLSAPERADLLGNAQALSGAGKLPVAEVLSLAERFHNDPERYVLQTALNLALQPRAHLVPNNLLPNYRRFLLKNFQARATELGWTPKAGESDDARLLRTQIVRPVATIAGDMELAGQAKELANKWFSDHSAIDPNMLGSVLGTAAYYGDKTLFDRMLAEFKSSKDRQIIRNLIGAMNSFRDRAAIEAGMNALINGDIPFIQGSPLLFAGQGEESTRKLSFEFLKAHWDQVIAKMPNGNGFDFGQDLPGVGASYCDASSREELKNFFAPKVGKFVGAPRALDQTLEQIDLCIANKAAQEPGVVAFLAKY